MLNLTNSVRELEDMWRKSQELHSELEKHFVAKGVEQIIDLIDTNINYIKNLLEDLIPAYVELLDKDELTPAEEWELRTLNSLLPRLKEFVLFQLTFLTGYGNFLPQNEKERLFEEIKNLLTFFEELFEEDFVDGYGNKN